MVAFDALLLGGGSGSRFSGGSGTPKQFHEIGQLPVFVYSIRAFERLGVRRVFFAVPQSSLALAEQLVSRHPSRIPVELVCGGPSRAQSAHLALEAASMEPPSRVLIHDACRPYFSDSFLENIRTALADTSKSAWIPGIPVTETLKRVRDGVVEATVDRTGMHRVQTPQIFDFPLIRDLASRGQELEPPVTDDASLCERFGVEVGVFPGDPRNLKLTFAAERLELESYLKGENRCESESAGTFTG